MTAFSRLSQFGTTFAPLMENRGKDVLMWFLEAFLVRTSHAPEKALESKASDLECGWKWHGSFVKWDRVSSSWRTRQCSLLAGLDVFLETWPRWGMMRDGECLELATLERPTSESESGLWRTPLSCEWKDMSCSTQIYLQDQVKMLPTPRATDGDKGSRTAQGAAKEWARGRNKDLGMVVAMWPTPQASDNRDRGNLGSGAILRRKEKGKQIGLSQSVSDQSGALNPPWVEWLMAWPIEWTDLKPLGTDKFQRWRLSHGESSVSPPPEKK
jgi:hypothetical protein